MNLADSVKKVLKTRSHHIFHDFWRDDLKNIVQDIASDIARLGRSGASTINAIKNSGFKFSIKETVDSGADALLIFKVLPSRVREGFKRFKDEFIIELDKLPDQKQKTLFCLKILGALTSFTIGAFYNIKKGKADFALSGLKRRNAFTQFIVAELVFKISQVFIYRFLSEVEHELSAPEDLKNVRYFKTLISTGSPVESDEDQSFILIDNLKRFIMTGN
jgi:hypothetical protein